MYRLNISYKQFYSTVNEIALWKRPKCPKYIQRTWWQTVATQHTGLTQFRANPLSGTMLVYRRQHQWWVIRSPIYRHRVDVLWILGAVMSYKISCPPPPPPPPPPRNDAVWSTSVYPKSVKAMDTWMKTSVILLSLLSLHRPLPGHLQAQSSNTKGSHPKCTPTVEKWIKLSNSN